MKHFLFRINLAWRTLKDPYGTIFAVQYACVQEDALAEEVQRRFVGYQIHGEVPADQTSCDAWFHRKMEEIRMEWAIRAADRAAGRRSPLRTSTSA